MLMGLNIPNIDIVINLGEISNLSDMWQAAGRAGRRRGGEKIRSVSVVYNLLNASDLANHSDNHVRDFFNSKECLKRGKHGLMSYYGWDVDFANIYTKVCCSNCNP